MLPVFHDYSLEYPSTLFLMQRTLDDIRHKNHPEFIWFLEHQPVYTYGRLTPMHALPQESSIPCMAVSRGGQITYHGPGQLTVYPLIDLRRRGWTVTDWLRILHQWGLDALQALGLSVWSDSGFWTQNAQGVTQKIGSIGIHIQNGISYHGFSINRTQASLEAFQTIQPCGLTCSMTSLENRGLIMTHFSLAQHFWEHCPLALKNQRTMQDNVF